jgi:hypothetical protein
MKSTWAHAITGAVNWKVSIELLKTTRSSRLLIWRENCALPVLQTNHELKGQLAGL